MSGFSYSRLLRYHRCCQSLSEAIDELDPEIDKTAFELVREAHQIMQSKLDMENEEYMIAREEEKANEYERRKRMETAE